MEGVLPISHPGDDRPWTLVEEAGVRLSVRAGCRRRTAEILYLENWETGNGKQVNNLWS